LACLRAALVFLIACVCICSFAYELRCPQTGPCQCGSAARDQPLPHWSVHASPASVEAEPQHWSWPAAAILEAGATKRRTISRQSLMPRSNRIEGFVGFARHAHISSKQHGFLPLDVQVHLKQVTCRAAAWTHDIPCCAGTRFMRHCLCQSALVVGAVAAWSCIVSRSTHCNGQGSARCTCVCSLHGNEDIRHGQR
jgi:hypothetical protein